MLKISKSQPDTWRSSPLVVTSYIDVSTSLPGTFSTDSCGFGWKFSATVYGDESFNLYFIPDQLFGAAYGRLMVTAVASPPHGSTQLYVEVKSFTQLTIGDYSGPSHFVISVEFPNLQVDIPKPPPPDPIPQSITIFEDLLSRTFRGEQFFNLKFWVFSRRTKGVAAHPKPIYASRSLLPQQMDWFENLLLPHDFAESKIVNIDDSDTSELAQRLNPEHYTYGSDSDLDDDDGAAEGSFHMLGQNTPNKHPEKPDRLQEVDRVASKSRVGQTQDSGNRPPSRAAARFGQVIAINDTAHRTFEALLWYTYTKKIEFRPLLSLASTSDEQTDGAKPRDFRCSPKSMYRLADKFNIEELKALSYSAIESNLCESNIVTELSSQLAYLYPPIQQMQAEYLAANFTLKVQEDLSYLVKDIVTQKVSPKAGHGMIMTIFLNLIKKGNANNPVLSLPVAYPEEEVKDES